jgi:tetratricopeptide (TPR) repeat protein
MKLLQLPLFLTLALSALSSYAVEPWMPSDAEMASLPAFCTAKMKSGQGSPEYRMWESTLGKDFLHTHHYCAGINFINRYYRSRSQQDKRFNLNNAVENLTYMVEHAAPEYSLMPDVYLNRGLAYSLMKQYGKAVTDMDKAIELNPHQVKAYNVLADYYSGAKQADKALETVSKGLKQNPGTASLQRRYTQLGGKLPYPEPIEPPPAATPQASASTALPEAPAASGKGDPEPEPTKATEAQPKIGSPNNPYCRFCP